MLRKSLVLLVVMLFVFGMSVFADNLESSTTFTLQTTVEPTLSVSIWHFDNLQTFFETYDNNGMAGKTITETAISENDTVITDTAASTRFEGTASGHEKPNGDYKAPMGLVFDVWSNKPFDITIDKPPLTPVSPTTTINNIIFKTTPFSGKAAYTVENLPSHGGNQVDIPLDGGMWYKNYASNGLLGNINYHIQDTDTSDDTIVYDMGYVGDGMRFVVPFYQNYSSNAGGNHWIHFGAGTYTADWTVTVSQTNF